jgi:ectoine hydroxylase-related dioxygenase (phytanoyl-CoA dioxygenase family)
MEHDPKTWKRAYEEDGFVIVPDLLDTATLSALRNAIDKITAEVHSLPPYLKEKIFLECDHVRNNALWYIGTLAPEQCGNTVRQIADIGIFDPVFAQLICYPPLLDVLEALFQSTEFSFTLMVGRPKAARVGNGARNGAFHRDTPDQDYTSANAIQTFLCLDDMNPDNGPTMLVRGSHRVSDEEAKAPRWISIDPGSIDPDDKVVVGCTAGSGLFFTSKIIHAAGHNRSGTARRTINIEWAGPDVLPTSPTRFAYQGLRPRSKDPVFQKQMRMTFPEYLPHCSAR